MALDPRLVLRLADGGPLALSVREMLLDVVAGIRRKVVVVAVVAVVAVGKEVVVEALLLAEAVLESRLFRGTRRHALVGKRRDRAARDEVDVVVVRVLHALTVVLAPALPVRSPIDGHEVGIRILAHCPAGAGIRRAANQFVEVGGTPAIAGSPVRVDIAVGIAAAVGGAFRARRVRVVRIAAAVRVALLVRKGVALRARRGRVLMTGGGRRSRAVRIAVAVRGAVRIAAEVAGAG